MCTGGTGDNVLHAMTNEKMEMTAMSQALHCGLAMRSYRVTFDRYSYRSIRYSYLVIERWLAIS